MKLVSILVLGAACLGCPGDGSNFRDGKASVKADSRFTGRDSRPTGDGKSGRPDTKPLVDTAPTALDQGECSKVGQPCGYEGKKCCAPLNCVYYGSSLNCQNP